MIIQGTFTLSPDFFHKRNGEAHEQPSWPRLEFLAIETTNITCTGNLYLPDANESTITWHESFFIDDILRKPTNDFNELMLSLSRGMLSMPKLQRLEILVRCNPNGIYYPLPYGARDSLSFRDIKLHRLIYYDREENESVPLAEFPPKDLWCNLGIFDRDYFRQRYIEVPCQLPWTACPEEALRNWNELHFRIKGHSILPEWRRKIVENGYQEDYVGYPFIQSARWVKQ